MEASFSINKANQDNQVDISAEVKLKSCENIDVVEAIPPCALALVFS